MVAITYFGLIVIVLGLAMFIIGIGTFTSRGEMNFILKEFGEFSFSWWFQTIIIGIIITLLPYLIKRVVKHGG